MASEVTEIPSGEKRLSRREIRRELLLMRAPQSRLVGPLLRRFAVPEYILETGMGYWPSRVVLTAIEFGVFTELPRGALTLSESIDKFGWDPGAEMRLDVATSAVLRTALLNSASRDQSRATEDPWRAGELHLEPSGVGATRKSGHPVFVTFDAERR